MKNFVQTGESIDAVLEEDTESGHPVIVNGALAGIAVTSGVEGDTIAAKRQGIFELPNTGDDFDFGDPVYWSASSKDCTKTAGANLVYIGRAAAAAADTAAVQVYVDTAFAGPLTAPVIPAAASGGDAPTEAEHNGLRTVLVAIVADLKAAGIYAS